MVIRGAVGRGLDETGEGDEQRAGLGEHEWRPALLSHCTRHLKLTEHCMLTTLELKLKTQ